MFKYEFTSTIDDLLDAAEAERTLTSMRAPFRWIVAGFGMALLVVGLFSFDISKPMGSLAPMLAGGVLFYFFALKPLQTRSQIKKNNAHSQHIILTFSDDDLELNIGGIGKVTRQWNELVGFVDTKEGILFYFTDDIINWLPRRVFINSSEKIKFIEFIREHFVSKAA